MNSKQSLPKRKALPHEAPTWAPDDAIYFITICTASRGVNILCHQPLAQALRESIEYRRNLKQWHVLLLVLMPDHLHMLARFARYPGMKQTITAWKKYTARQFEIRWQRDFFDHRLRDGKAVIAKAEYVRRNPVRAGYVIHPEDWPYLWEMPSQQW